MPENIAPHPDVSIADAAAFLSLSAVHVQRLIDSGILPDAARGQETRVPVSALRRYRDRVETRHAVLDELAAEAQRAGLYDHSPHGFVR